MRLLFYNILDGCMGDPDRLAALLAWIRRQDADVVGLAELNGWDAPGVFDRNRRACGYEHGHLLSKGPSAYNIGVLSHSPIEGKAEVTEGVHHGILHVRTAGLDVLVTHFSPDDPELRVAEARMCAAMARKVRGPLVLMGDLNSHSPADGEEIRQSPAPEDPLCVPDFRPHEVLREAGLIDLGVGRPGGWTTRTALNPGEPRRRLDFIYANRRFRREHSPVSVHPVRDAEVDRLSDHYPVVLLAPGRGDRRQWSTGRGAMVVKTFSLLAPALAALAHASMLHVPSPVPYPFVGAAAAAAGIVAVVVSVIRPRLRPATFYLVLAVLGALAGLFYMSVVGPLIVFFPKI